MISTANCLRPFFSKLIELVHEFIAAIPRQGVDHELLSPWPEIFAYGLPTEQARE